MSGAVERWSRTIDKLDASVTADEAHFKQLREAAETIVEDCQAVFVNTAQGKRVLAFLELTYLGDPPSPAMLGKMAAEDIKALLASYEAEAGVVRKLKNAIAGKVNFTLTD